MISHLLIKMAIARLMNKDKIKKAKEKERIKKAQHDKFMEDMYGKTLYRISKWIGGSWLLYSQNPHSKSLVDSKTQ